MLANLLGMQGVRTLVLEREANMYDLPRAVHFDDEIMRAFQTIGIAHRLNEKVIVNKGMRFCDYDDNLLARLATQAIPHQQWLACQLPLPSARSRAGNPASPVAQTQRAIRSQQPCQQYRTIQ